MLFFRLAFCVLAMHFFCCIFQSCISTHGFCLFCIFLSHVLSRLLHRYGRDLRFLCTLIIDDSVSFAALSTVNIFSYKNNTSFKSIYDDILILL